MTFKSYLKLVEIQTKVASIIPFTVGSLYALAIFGKENFSLLSAALMLGSLLCIDMATTALNNYMDFKRARRKHGYGYEVHNAIVRFELSENQVVTTIGLLLLLGSILGVFLVIQTHLLILALGAISFLVGILYSFGPIPISRTALGEFFSGAFMGVGIPVIAVMIHLPLEAFIMVSVDKGWAYFGIRWFELLKLILATMPLFAAIANIMLANNICDQHEDLDNHRYTLPITIGTKAALFVYEQLYFFGYLCLLVVISIGGLPWWFILYSITLIPTLKAIRLFKTKQVKKETFVLSVKTFVIQGVAYIALFSIWLILQ